jgi:hypothetical protein
MDGKKAPADELKAAEVIITEGKMILRAKGEASEVKPWQF